VPLPTPTSFLEIALAKIATRHEEAERERRLRLARSARVTSDAARPRRLVLAAVLVFVVGVLLLAGVAPAGA
jgi:hypothetical protein